MDPNRHASRGVTDLLDQCRMAAKQKNYDAALEAVNAALKLDGNQKTAPSSTLDMLDYRHAIYIRRDDLDSALKDAKSMIRLDRTDARGYIRSGVVERLKDNKAAALKFFEHGLKSAPSSDPNLALLRKELKQTRDQISADLVVSKARDPMALLPFEIIEFVMLLIEHRQHVQMLRVSRLWKRILSGMRPLIDTLAFPGSDNLNSITPKMFLAALRRISVLKTLNAIGLTWSSSDILISRLEHSQAFRSLECLEVRDAHLPLDKLPVSQYKLRRVTIDYPTKCPLDLVHKLLEECPGLEVASFRKVTHRPQTYTLCSKSLLELDFNYGETMRSAVSKYPLPRCYVSYADLIYEKSEVTLDLPQIKRLGLGGLEWGLGNIPPDLDLQHLEQLESLSLYNCTISNLLLAPSLRRLKTEHCLFAVQESSTSFPALENLESLHMFSNHARPQEWSSYSPFIRQAASKTAPGRLLSLGLYQDLERSNDLLSLLTFRWFKGLTSLQLRGPAIKDEHSRLFIANCPDLETFSLYDAQITGVFVSDLIKAPTSRLRKITLRECLKVSQDIVPWAKERGVEIDTRPYVTKTVGLKVRERH